MTKRFCRWHSQMHFLEKKEECSDSEFIFKGSIGNTSAWVQIMASASNRRQAITWTAESRFYLYIYIYIYIYVCAPTGIINSRGIGNIIVALTRYNCSCHWICLVSSVHKDCIISIRTQIDGNQPALLFWIKSTDQQKRIQNQVMVKNTCIYPKLTREWDMLEDQ